MGTEEGWVQRTRGKVGTEEQRKSRNRGTEEQRNRGTEEQLVQRTSWYRGPEEQ